jgi:ORF6N domain
MPKPIPSERIARAILVLRGQRVLLDTELASLYGVAAKVLLQAVRRNRKRFPQDFMTQLSAEEWAALRSQIVTSNSQRGGRRYRPFAFTGLGDDMDAALL